MARKTNPSSSRSTFAVILSIVILLIAVLGALDIIDTVALDDALEPLLGVRLFMTEPRPPGSADSAADELFSGDGGAPLSGGGEPGDWWTVYFTNPGMEENYIENELIARINASTQSIHIASFEFNLDRVAEALIAAHQRGVEIQWVTDDEFGIEADEEEDHGQFEMLEDAGIEIRDDQRSALMHNKFWVFDQSAVWTGSTNITHNGTLLNNNNVIVLESEDVAAIYEREFQEMWAGDEFGPSSPSTINQQNVEIDNSLILVRFAPEDEIGTLLAELLGKAQSEIRFMAFSFTHDDMGGSILQRSRDGVSVAGIFEQRGSETEFSEFSLLYCAGLPVRQDGNPRILHHKVLIIDGRIVVTGSFNFSRNADESNDENVVIIDNPDIAAEYLKEFERRWAESQLPAEADISCP